MPTNLPPDYYEVEKQYRAASSPEEKAAYLEEMLSIVPKHKGTDHLRVVSSPSSKPAPNPPRKGVAGANRLSASSGRGPVK